MKGAGKFRLNRCGWRIAVSLAGIVFLLSGCGGRRNGPTQTAVGGHIDFDELTELNPEIFAWVYVPGTDIDYPILQSAESDVYYEDHNWKGEEDEEGSLYTEMANLMNMCDFNTIVHGHTNSHGTMLSSLHNFSDRDFFDKNGQVYVYLPDNVLTYEIISCYTEEKHSIIRDYNLVSYDGCEEYIEDMKNLAKESGIYRDGWDEITPYHFLLSFVTDCPEDDGMQYIVTAALVKDSAGNINRIIYEY